MFQADAVHPEYLSDFRVLGCPSQDKHDHDAWWAKGWGFRLVDDHCYVYFAHMVRSEEELLSYVSAYKAAREAGADLNGDLVAPDGNVLPRLREGAVTSIERAQIPVMMEHLHHEPRGGHVLYMDGHVEFVEYEEKWPMTDKTLDALESIGGWQVNP
jgi:prepilin-type processing-associated H-X9-DG protein